MPSLIRQTSATSGMFELRDTRPDVNVQETEYRRLLGYPPDFVPEGRSRELADWARRWYAEHGRPWAYARQVDDLEPLSQGVEINGARFCSEQLRDQFITAQAHTAVLVAVSAGPECEVKARELWHQGNPEEYFFLEVYGSAVVEHLVVTTGGRICAWADQNGMAVLPHYSPGYSGWDISDQIRLWETIGRNGRAALPGDLNVFDTGMLQPKKSLLAVFGVTRALDKVRAFSNLVPCENCALPACQYRRAPYRRSLPQIEDVRRLQPPQPDLADTNPAPGLLRNAAYTVNLRALRKWSQERLQLNVLPDGRVEGRFRYEGTTCSNLGQPLAFDYYVQLGRAEDGYPIIGADCTPAPGDIGHTQMCEYLANADTLMHRIAQERPLLGRPLSEVFQWDRSFSPSGCYCSEDRRAHKWGLVLEVIHFALVQREQQRKPADGKRP